MDELFEIYKQIEYLRNRGVKMKEIADYTNLAPSVLSSLYSNVLPTFANTVRKGTPNSNKENQFIEMLNEEMQHSAQEIYNYSGIYMSYSLSSSTDSLKAEPYLIASSEGNDYVQVTHMSAYHSTHRGIGLLNNHQNAYIMFNERETPQLALFTIYLQLPMFDYPQMLKGLYLCLDYNRNPIARRIVFVKISDSTCMDDFLELKGELIPKDKLTAEQEIYYNYTCQEGDYIKTCTVPSPQLNENDLIKEKKILND